MAHSDVYACVSAVVPCRHMEWPDDSAPALPWAVYTCEDDPIVADDFQMAVTHRWTVELYEKRRDAELERELGDAIVAAFGNYTKRESWIASQDCLMVTYDFREIEGEDHGQ